MVMTTIKMIMNINYVGVWTEDEATTYFTSSSSSNCSRYFVLLVCHVISSVLLIFLIDVIVYPTGFFVSYEGGNATFHCYSLPFDIGRVTSVQWLINGSLLDSLGFDNAQPDFDPNSANGIGSLILTNLTPNFNMTRVQCRAHFRSMPSSTSTEATIILLQGNFSRLVTTGR